MRIAIGADHAGFILKDHLRARLTEAGHDVHDFGAHAADSVDYPDYAALVARAVAGGSAERGILVCGSGIGMAIAANRVRGVRAAACIDLYSTRLCRQHNDANVLTLGARFVGRDALAEILETFLTTACTEERHARRVRKITAIEESFRR